MAAADERTGFAQTAELILNSQPTLASYELIILLLGPPSRRERREQYLGLPHESVTNARIQGRDRGDNTYNPCQLPTADFLKPDVSCA
jgi:hypothetical protein